MERKVKKFEKKFQKILKELAKKYFEEDFEDIEIVLSELMRLIISVQESNFDGVVLLKSDLGKYFQATLNIYSKITEIPSNVNIWFVDEFSFLSSRQC